MQITYDKPLGHGRVVYDRLAKLQNDILAASDEKDVEVYILTEKRSARNFLFIVSTLRFLPRKQLKPLRMFIRNNLVAELKQMDAWDFRKSGTDRYKDLKTPDEAKDAFQSYINELTSRTKILFDDQVGDDLLRALCEIYNNSYEHSEGKNILYNCFVRKSKRQFCFSLYDNGSGIPQNVREYLRPLLQLPDEFFDQITNDEATLRWALKPRHSTAKSGTARGYGLDVILKFAELNKGEVRICTGKVLYVYKDGNAKMHKLRNTFFGTLFELHVNIK